MPVLNQQLRLIDIFAATSAIAVALYFSIEYGGSGIFSPVLLGLHWAWLSLRRPGDERIRCLLAAFMALAYGSIVVVDFDTHFDRLTWGPGSPVRRFTGGERDLVEVAAFFAPALIHCLAIVLLVLFARPVTRRFGRLFAATRLRLPEQTERTTKDNPDDQGLSFGRRLQIRWRSANALIFRVV